MDPTNLSNEDLMKAFQSYGRGAQPAQTDVSSLSDEQLMQAYQSSVGGGQKQSSGPLEGFRDSGVGVGRGLTAGFSDELFAAGMTPFEMARGAIRGTDEGKGFVDRVTDAYGRALDFNRSYEKQAMERSPIATGIGEAAGAVMTSRALPGGRVAPTAGLQANVVGSMKNAATYGALHGAGTGENLTDRATGAITQGAVGAGLGLAAPLAVEGVARGVSAAVRPVVQAYRGFRDPEAEAARRVTSGLVDDFRSGTAGMTPQEFAAERAAGTPVSLMEMGGETTRALARSSANTDATARASLQEMTTDRFRAQAPRIADWFENNFSVKLTSDVAEKLQAEARKVNRPAYAKAYQDGSRGLWDGELEQLVQAPEVQNAIRIAQVQAKNWAVKEGFRPPVNAFEIQGGRTVLKKSESGNTYLPSLQLLDYVKRALDQQQSPTSGSFAKTLRDHLDTLVPSYQTARSGAAKYFGKGDALEAGAEFALTRTDPREAAKTIAKYSPDERKLFESGFVSTIVNRIREHPDRRDVLQQLATSPNARQRIELAIGPRRARELEARLHTEEIMDFARTAVQGNSTTARQLAEIGLAGGAATYGGVSAYNLDPMSVGQSVIAGALIAGNRRIDQRVAREVGRLLASNDPQLLQRGFRIVSNNQQMMDALRGVYPRLGAVSGQNAPAGLLPSGTVPTRAEQDQQNR